MPEVCYPCMEVRNGEKEVYSAHVEGGKVLPLVPRHP
jgi:hypothetical protein